MISASQRPYSRWYSLSCGHSSVNIQSTILGNLLRAQSLVPQIVGSFRTTGLSHDILMPTRTRIKSSCLPVKPPSVFQTPLPTKLGTTAMTKAQIPWPAALDKPRSKLPAPRRQLLHKSIKVYQLRIRQIARDQTRLWLTISIMIPWLLISMAATFPHSLSTTT